MDTLRRSTFSLSRFFALIILLGCLLLIACSGTSSQSPTPTFTAQQADGQAVVAANCSRCHATGNPSVVVGPSLMGIAARAGDRVPGLDARAYITQSILEPDAYVVEGFPDNLMPEDFSEKLGQEDIEAVVAYLLTLDK